MTACLTVWSFADEGLSEGSMLPGVGSEIRTFRSAEKDLKKAKLFPCVKACKLDGHERLSLAYFPNLCKVANSRKRKLDETFKDYKSTKEGQSRLRDLQMGEGVSQPPMGGGAEDREAPKEAFGITDEDINPSFAKVARQSQPCERDSVSVRCSH